VVVVGILVVVVGTVVLRSVVPTVVVTSSVGVVGVVLQSDATPSGVEYLSGKNSSSMLLEESACPLLFHIFFNKLSFFCVDLESC